MQIGLTNNVYEHYKIKKTNRKIKRPSFFSVFLIFIILVIFLFAIYPKNHDKINVESDVYFIVADYNLSSNNLNKVTSNVEDYGGAGVVYDFDNLNNAVIIFAYFNQNDAEKINNSCKNIFPSSSVKSIKINKMSKILQTKIQNDKNLYDYYEFVCNEKYNSYNILIAYEKGEISFNTLYDYAYELKSKIQLLCSNFNDDDISEKLKISSDKLIKLLDTFLDNNLKGEYSQLFFKKFVVNIILEEIYIKTNILR